LADGSDEDNEVVVPIRTALRRVFNSTWLNPIFVSVRNPGEMAETESAIARLLRDRHRREPSGKPDDFSIQNKTRVLAAQKQVAESLNLLATTLAAISLFVGGAGILALMLMSVKERTGEIGLRIAVGARPRDILVQFLMEAAFLAIGGWAVGITLGTLGAAVVAFATRWKVAMSPEQVLVTLGMVLTIALGFGAYPARKASLVPPIEALQVE
jgi:putative ABC transport system permease protein